MVGEGLVKNLSFFRLYQTPWSLPTYLNDVAASFIEGMADSQDAAQQNAWLGAGAVVAPTGSRDPFYYRLDAYEASSDNIVFVDGAAARPGRVLQRLAGHVVPHERRHARQVRCDPVQAGGHDLGRGGPVPGQRRTGRGREDDGRYLRPPARTAGPGPGQGRRLSRQSRRRDASTKRPRRPASSSNRPSPGRGRRSAPSASSSRATRAASGGWPHGWPRSTAFATPTGRASTTSTRSAAGRSRRSRSRPRRLPMNCG